MLSHPDTQPLLFPGATATVWCVFAYVLAAFKSVDVFDFGIFHLSGWQFKTSKWNISEPFCKLHRHTHEVIVVR